MNLVDLTDCDPIDVEAKSQARWWKDQGARTDPEARPRTDPTDRRSAYSTVFMPDGSQVCIAQNAAQHASPEQATRFYDLQMVMSNQWAHVLALVALREWSGRSESFDEEHAYCPRCQCNKNGYWQEPNARTEACDDHDCLCHEEDE